MDKLNKSSAIFLFTLFLCFGTSTGIWCYRCTSESTKDCLDPFNKTIHENLLVDCSNVTQRFTETAVVCRKQVIHAYDTMRIIRDCGYIEHDRDDKKCIKASHGERSGVSTHYCACKSDKCNSADRNSKITPLLIITVIFSTIYKFY